MPCAAASRPTCAWAFRSGASECGVPRNVGVRRMSSRIRSTLRSSTSSFRAPLASAARSAFCWRGRCPASAARCRPSSAPPASRPPNQSVITSPSKPQSSRSTPVSSARALRGVGAVQLVVGRHDRPRLRLRAPRSRSPAGRSRAAPAGTTFTSIVLRFHSWSFADEVLRRRARRPATARPSPWRRPSGPRPADPPSSTRSSARRAGLRWVLSAGPSSTSTPYSRTSFPIARPTRSTRSTSQRRRQQRLDREGRAVVRARSRPPRASGWIRRPAGPSATTIGGNPEARNRERRPGGARDARAASRRRPAPCMSGGQAGELHAGAHDEVDLLLPRHRGDDVLRGALAELREVHGARLDGARQKQCPSLGDEPGPAARHHVLLRARPGMGPPLVFLG